jgi:hypothetical protein
MADLNQKLCELTYGAFDSSEGAWATISRHLQVVADNVPLSNYFFKHQQVVADSMIIVQTHAAHIAHLHHLPYTMLQIIVL